ncbi:MAG: hypothetical protein R6W67_02250 [Bacteroidales bacterium]
MKKIPAIFALVFLTANLHGQSVTGREAERPSMTFYVNFLGEGSLLSLNLEKSFLNTTLFFLNGRAGAGFSTQLGECLSDPCETNPSDFLILPHHLTFCIGKGKHYFEAGIGGTVILGNTTQHYIPFPTAGYRMHPVQKSRVYLRIMASYPLVKELADISWLPYGVSIGMSF